MLKNLPATAGDPRDMDSVPGSGRSPGGGHGNPFQYSCLENPKDRRARRATAHGVERVADFIFLDSKITVDGVCNHESKEACSLKEKL